MDYTDDVNGEVIGDFRKPYKFYSYPKYPSYTFDFIDITWAESDEDAIQWFKENYPKQFKEGIQMRCGYGESK